MFRVFGRSMLAAGMVAGISACSTGDDGNGTDASQVSVLATTTIWADVANEVACADDVDVSSLMGTGVDPHDFEPSLADRDRIDNAVAVIANGAGLEHDLADTIEASDVAVFWMDQHVSVVDDDPHFWFDPTTVSPALDALGDFLVAEAELPAEQVSDCVAAYQAQLAELDSSIEARIDAIPADQRMLVTNHDALSYYANRYGLDIIGTVLPASSSLAETSPSQIDDLADSVEALGVPAVFSEAGHQSTDAEAVAQRAGVPVIELLTGSLAASGQPGDTYLGMLDVDTDRIVEGLSP